jgi:hypothetical protein
VVELLLRKLVTERGGDYGDEQGVLRDPLRLRLASDEVGEVGGKADQFLGCGHSGQDSTCASSRVLVSALSESAPASSSSRGMAKETELPMQAQGTQRRRPLGFDYYADLVFDRQAQELREAIDAELRHWHGHHLERAGQIPFPGLERPNEEITVGASLGAVA